MGAALEAPKRPLVAILGGAKVADKIGVIKNLLQKADTILIGGGMSYTFLAAQGRPIGTSLLDADHVDYARQMLDQASQLGVNLLLPLDNLAAKEFSPDAAPVLVDAQNFPEDVYKRQGGRRAQGKHLEAHHLPLGANPPPAACLGGAPVLSLPDLRAGPGRPSAAPLVPAGPAGPG